MRQITDHIVSGDQAVQLEVVALGDIGPGGADNEYSIKAKFPRPSPELLARIPLEKLCEIAVGKEGDVTGEMCRISFQNGPIRECGVNGITHEALLAILLDRLRAYQNGPYCCADNEEAIEGGMKMLHALQRRTLARIARGVEGTMAK
jgi:hypothetical protein